MVCTSPPWYYRDTNGLENMVVSPQAYVNFNMEVINLFKKPLMDRGVIFWHTGDKDERGIPDMLATAVTAGGWLLQKTIKWGEAKILVITKQEDYQWDDSLPFGDDWSDVPYPLTGIYMCKQCRRFYLNGEMLPVVDALGEINDAVSCGCGSADFHIHFGVFPEEIARRCILLASKEWELNWVVDPFAGTGTVGVAARRLHRISTLCETNKDFCEMIEERLRQRELLIDRENFGPDYNLGGVGRCN